MCDHEHYSELRSRVDRIEDSMAVYHTKTDERIKTLFNACREMSRTASLLMRFSMGIMSFVVVVTLLALVYGAVGHSGFNAVTHAAREVRP